MTKIIIVVEFFKTSRGGSGSFGTVYVYSGKIDGKSIEVAVKTFKKDNDAEFIVLKYIKDKKLNLCKTCPSVVCLDQFDKKVALEALSKNLTFSDILLNTDPNNIALDSQKFREKIK